jgi:hypothetical protein
MIGGASITELALDGQNSIHETTNNTDVTGNATLQGNDDTAVNSLLGVERQTSEDASGLFDDDNNYNVLRSLREGGNESALIAPSYYAQNNGNLAF